MHWKITLLLTIRTGPMSLIVGWMVQIDEIVLRKYLIFFFFSTEKVSLIVHTYW